MRETVRTIAAALSVALTDSHADSSLAEALDALERSNGKVEKR